MLGGNGNIGDTIGDDLIDGNRDPTLTSSLGKTFGEPNGAFAQGIVAVYDGGGVARLQGSVSSVGDLDVFLLGALAPGDRVIVDADTTGSVLDVTVAMFDAFGRLVVNNDDRGGPGSRALDSFTDLVVRHAGDQAFLVVTHSPFADAGTFTGSYFIDVQITGPVTVPEPVAQVLLLNFAGGLVDAPILGNPVLPPFDGGDIDRIYRGQTQTIKDMIVSVMEQNFARFAVIIVTSDDPPLPSGTLLTTVHFGGFDPGAFGVAENVDLYNADFCDDAIIFAESFDPRFFSLSPTAGEMGIAIGNVASHEAGHLLGLNHVDDDLALMDDQSAADVFLTNQEFIEALLSPDIMTIGTQDAALLLDEIVGPRSATQRLPLDVVFEVAPPSVDPRRSPATRATRIVKRRQMASIKR